MHIVVPLSVCIGGGVSATKNREIDARGFHLGPIDFSLPFTYVDAFIRADAGAIPFTELVKPIKYRIMAIGVGFNRTRHYAIGGIGRIGGRFLERAQIVGARTAFA